MHCRLVLFFDNLVVVIGILKECWKKPFSRFFLGVVSEGVLPRLTKALCKAICIALFVIKSEEVPQLLVVFAMRQRRVGDNRNALSGWRACQRQLRA